MALVFGNPIAWILGADQFMNIDGPLPIATTDTDDGTTWTGYLKDPYNGTIQTVTLPSAQAATREIAPLALVLVPAGAPAPGSVVKMNGFPGIFAVGNYMLGFFATVWVYLIDGAGIAFLVAFEGTGQFTEVDTETFPVDTLIFPSTQLATLKNAGGTSGTPA